MAISSTLAMPSLPAKEPAIAGIGVDVALSLTPILVTFTSPVAEAGTAGVGVLSLPPLSLKHKK
jgi:hypothetical protein